MTKEEEKKLTDAMQKPEFRELLFDYVKEIQDPANREQYESELKKEKSSLFWKFFIQALKVRWSDFYRYLNLLKECQRII